MHLDAEKIERLLANEMTPEEARVWRDHLVGCNDCARILEDAERQDREIAGQLGLLDHAVPDTDLRQLRRRATRPALRRTLAAAAVAFLIVAAAASAMPGSPVRSWLSRVFAGAADTSRQATTGEGAGVAAIQPSGVSVLPGGSFELVFDTLQDSGVVRITLSDEPEVSVRSEGSGVGYSVEPSRVRVLNAGSTASYRVVLPEDATSIRILVGDTPVLVKRGATIETSAPRDVTGDYLVSFATLHRRAP